MSDYKDMIGTVKMWRNSEENKKGVFAICVNDRIMDIMLGTRKEAIELMIVEKEESYRKLYEINKIDKEEYNKVYYWHIHDDFKIVESLK